MSNTDSSSPDAPGLLPVMESCAPEPLTSEKVPSAWRDSIGIFASIACAIHCAAMPFVIGFLPALGLSFLADESFHKWMAGVCFLVALAAFVPGFKRHRRCLPGAIAATGLTIVTVAAFGLSDECCAACEIDVAAESAAPDCCETHCEHCEHEHGATVNTSPAEPQVASAGIMGFFTENAAWWTPLGGALLVFGHLLNRCFVSRCKCCAPAE